MSGPILDIHDLSVTHRGQSELSHLSLTLDAGETLVVLGEAASGKDALLRVLNGSAEPGDEISGTIRFGGAEQPARKARPDIRLAYLVGPSTTPLSPYAPVVSQLVRVVARRLGSPRGAAREELRIALERFDGAPPFFKLNEKPGALTQMEMAWALLAAAIAQNPELLIADHAFSDLSPSGVETMARALLAEQKRLGFALLYAARGLMAPAHLASRVIVLRRGQVIEEGSFARLASGQSHAYTKTLFRAMPHLSDAGAMRGPSRGEPLLQVQGLDLRPPNAKGRPRDEIGFELRRGAALALVGEEGSGRHTLVRALFGLQRFAGGRVVLDQVDLTALSESMTARLRRRIAFITGADDALDPRMTLWDTVHEPLRAHLRLSREMVAGHREAALKRVGLASHDGQTPVALLSPFDKRRLQVARAIVSTPFLAVIDEPLRGLDAFAQSIMTELLQEFRRQEGPAFLVVTADVRVARVLADSALFFKDGRVVERGTLTDILQKPRDDETKRLIAAASPAIA